MFYIPIVSHLTGLQFCIHPCSLRLWAWLQYTTKDLYTTLLEPFISPNDGLKLYDCNLWCIEMDIGCTASSPCRHSVCRNISMYVCIELVSTSTVKTNWRGKSLRLAVWLPAGAVAQVRQGPANQWRWYSWRRKHMQQLQIKVDVWRTRTPIRDPLACHEYASRLRTYTTLRRISTSGCIQLHPVTMHHDFFTAMTVTMATAAFIWPPF